MEDPLQKENPKFEKLGRYYLIALCAIAMAIVLSQVLVQKFISDQESDSELVNLSGRQRMLSQKISKSALLMGTLTTQDERASLLDDFQNSLLTWRQSHQWLQKQTNSKTITDLFSQINPLHQEMADAADRIVVALSGRSKISPDIKKDIDTIILYEGRFLEGMDAIVNQFDEEARSKVNNLKNISVFLTAVSLGIILFEIFFVFFPSARSIRKTVQKLSASQE
ncbi:MAG TPA: type IV pili methyl-accepting chemotaxis transducer N-terminal domain-containing protein, partial [Cyclobacteriaceae bacterium]|nr:type IV pili methyl-accepting chemotaxis transducer N-terminal domain-containing protein [Cyclobacteriaceae bacterium]